MKHRLTFQRSIRIGRPAGEVFAWHEAEGAFKQLLPPWQKLQVVERQGGIRDGATVSLRVKVGMLWIRWDLEHRDYVQGLQFRDVQMRGPFRTWEHLHRMEPDGPQACVLTDSIVFSLPFGGCGRLMGGAIACAQLSRLFAFRHRVTKRSFEDGVHPAGESVT